MHTVFHVSSIDAYRTAEPKIRNLLDDETLDLDGVAVAVDRPAVIDAAADAESAVTDALVGMGATVKLCSNAARGASAGKDDFGAGVQFVPSGVGELTRLQTNGWAYIRL
jgi:intracellular sulfur oxidation DsrE/DsrF family protein